MVLVNPLTMMANSNGRGEGWVSRTAASSPVRAAPWLNPKIPSMGGAVRSSPAAQSRLRSQPRNPWCHQPKSPSDSEGASAYTSSVPGGIAAASGAIWRRKIAPLPW